MVQAVRGPKARPLDDERRAVRGKAVHFLAHFQVFHAQRQPQRQAIAAPYRRARLDAYVAEHVARLHQRDMFFRQGHVQARHAVKIRANALEGE